MIYRNTTQISKWILNTSFKEGQGLAGNQWALVAWSPNLALQHRCRCEETGALLESELLFSHSSGHNWKLSLGSPQGERKGHHLMKKLQNEPGKQTATRQSSSTEDGRESRRKQHLRQSVSQSECAGAGDPYGSVRKANGQTQLVPPVPREMGLWFTLPQLEGCLQSS